MDWIAISALIVSGFALVLSLAVVIRNESRIARSISVPIGQGTAPRPIIIQVNPGAERKGPFIAPSLGESKLIKYNPEDYDESLRCCSCTREFVFNETFWAIDVSDSPGGVLGVCSTCYGKAVA